MSEDPGSTGHAGSAQPAALDPAAVSRGAPGWSKAGRRRRPGASGAVRIALASAAAIVVVAAGVAVSGFALVNHLAGRRRA